MSVVMQYFSNILSALIILSCLFLKVPQIISIKQKKSVSGIPVQAMTYEVIGFTIISLYNFCNEYSILTYMEYVIILIQLYVLFYYVLRYNRNPYKQMIMEAMVGIYIVLVFTFAIEWIPRAALSYLMPCCTPLSGFAKLSYIYSIVSTKKADSIATTTWVISVATNVGRIFTVYMDSGDMKLMINFFISSLLSAGVLASVIYYKNYPRPPRPRRVMTGGARRFTFDKD